MSVDVDVGVKTVEDARELCERSNDLEIPERTVADTDADMDRSVDNDKVDLPDEEGLEVVDLLMYRSVTKLVGLLMMANASRPSRIFSSSLFFEWDDFIE